MVRHLKTLLISIIYSNFFIENEDPSQVPDKLDENEPTENNENKNDKSEDNHESKDQSSKEDNVQSMPNEQNKGSNDQVIFFLL